MTSQIQSVAMLALFSSLLWPHFAVSANELPPSAPNAASTGALPSTFAQHWSDPWDLSDAQKSILATLPKSVDEQRKELLRLSRIPLPTYEERKRFEALTGQRFPMEPRHPLRDNETWLIEHYRALGKPSKTELAALIASLKKRMIHLRGGPFMMGDFGPLVFKPRLTLTGGKQNGPPHEVMVDGYAIMKGRVTHGEFDLYLRSQGRPPLDDDGSIYFRRPGYVVIDVTWHDADGYCQWLARITSKPFALPTEAQWEYAAREGGKLIAYPMYHWPDVKWQNKYQPVFATAEKAITKREIQAGRPGGGFSMPYPPGLHGENRIGMQSVLGSGSWEWVADWYQDDYYSVSPKHNPRGPEAGTERVVRVGSETWANTILNRHKQPPEKGTQFRCVLNDPKPWR